MLLSRYVPVVVPKLSSALLTVSCCFAMKVRRELIADVLIAVLWKWLVQLSVSKTFLSSCLVCASHAEISESITSQPCSASSLG